eukprot:CAMPEP_0172922714 /NCGR_PEP_ID=MMETSP1075-20121228/208432_1 /TAXON_ID=2916 /ORGANISM="Ceratium fusus, Strain PA161109" /LENGTH=79 /DNA_ID=CAMNT_0013783071 /DNA_START=36 /DNA_END=271 /DNA_ORIENTATION=+
MHGNQVIVWTGEPVDATAPGLDQTPMRKTYSVDWCYDHSNEDTISEVVAMGQERFFSDCGMPLVEGALQGHDSCLMAYG